MTRFVTTVAAAAIFGAAAAPASAAVGPFDPSFGDDGKVVFGLGEGPAVADVAAEPSGDYVLAGSGNPAGGDYSLVRVTTSGAVDRTFGSQLGARPFFPPGGPGAGYVPVALAARPGGGWLTAGNDGRVALAAHRADGSLDPAFGSGGLAHVDVAAQSRATALAVLPDGRILVAARTPQQHVVVARVTPSGTLDTGWGSGGISEFTPPGATGVLCDEEFAFFGVKTIRPVEDGLVLLASTLVDPRNGHPVPALTRLRADGTLDTRFGTTGTSVLSPPGGSGVVAGLVMRNGLATVGMTVGNQCDEDLHHTRFGAMRIHSDGTRDRSYGRRGTALASFPVEVRAHDMVGLPGGRVTIVGGHGRFAPKQWAIARFTDTGRLDSRFGGGRTCSEVVGGAQDGDAKAAIPLSRTRVLVAGATQSDSGSVELARYRSAFTRGGVECFQVDEPAQGSPMRSVRLRAILGRRGRLRLVLRRGIFATRGPTRLACLGTAPSGDVVAVWDGRANGRTLRPGIYTMNLELRSARGRLLGRSHPYTVQLFRRASGPRRSGAC